MFARKIYRLVLSITLLVVGILVGFAQDRRVEAITVRGLKNVSEEAVTTALKLRVGEPFTQSALESDRQTILAMGLFSEVNASIQPGETGVRVQFDVVENPLIKEVRFVGNTVLSTEQLTQVIRNKPGFVFNTNLARSDISAIQEAYQRAGYIVLPEGYNPPDYENGVLEILLSELRVGDIKIEGNTKTRTHVILREIRTKPGDLFNIPRWQRDINRLYNTGYFDRIEPEEQAGDPGEVDIVLRFKERPTGRLNVGFAIDSRRRLIGLAEIYETNFRGNGQTIGVNFQSTGGRNGNSIELSFTEPYLDRHRTSLSISLYDKLVYRFTSNFFGGSPLPTDQEDRYDERRRGITIGVGRPFGDFFNASIGLRTEDVSTNRVATTAGGGFIRQDGSLTSLTLRGVYNTRDLDLDPATGQFLMLTIEPGTTNIRSAEQQFIDAGVVKLGRSNFLRASLDYRLFFSPQGRRINPDDRRQVFAARFYYGTLTGSVPFFEQFFIGGAESLRGYPEDRFWGKQAFLFSFEFRQPVEKAFTAVFFVDIGHAWGGYPTVNNFTQSRSFKPEIGYGFGIRVRTPLGPLRIDYGIGRDGGRTHFSVGQVF